MIRQFTLSFIDYTMIQGVRVIRTTFVQGCCIEEVRTFESGESRRKEKSAIGGVESQGIVPKYVPTVCHNWQLQEFNFYA